MSDVLSVSSIARVVRGMALARARDALLPVTPVSPAAIAAAERLALAREAARFFGLGEDVAQTLAPRDTYPLWAECIHEAIAAQSQSTITFMTSGSTGQPRPYTHSMADLREEVAALRPFFTDRKRFVSVMPLHHAFGFAFALMLPDLLDLPVREASPLPSADFFRELRDGDCILGFPVFWRSLLECCSGRGALACPPDIVGVTSAAPCPPEIIEGLLALRGNSAPLLRGMTEIYGATEFGAVGIRQQCRGPYALLEHWQRAPILSPAGADAIWGIRRCGGPTLSLPDAVAWQNETIFLPLRRKDNAVQIGGVNVFPDRVAALLREHPDVRDCAVRLMRPHEGARLKAFVVPRPGTRYGRELIRELKTWVATRLDPAERPRSFTLGPALPLTVSGKTADWPISAARTNRG